MIQQWKSVAIFLSVFPPSGHQPHPLLFPCGTLIHLPFLYLSPTYSNSSPGSFPQSKKVVKSLPTSKHQKKNKTPTLSLWHIFLQQLSTLSLLHKTKLFQRGVYSSCVVSPSSSLTLCLKHLIYLFSLLFYWNCVYETKHLFSFFLTPCLPFQGFSFSAFPPRDSLFPLQILLGWPHPLSVFSDIHLLFLTLPNISLI